MVAEEYQDDKGVVRSILCEKQLRTWGSFTWRKIVENISAVCKNLKRYYYIEKILKLNQYGCKRYERLMSENFNEIDSNSTKGRTFWRQ